MRGRKRTRNRHQSGNVKARVVNGRRVWRCQWREHGRPRTKDFPRATYSQAQARTWLDKVLAEFNRGATPDRPVLETFVQFFDKVFLPHVTGGKWKRSTLKTTEPRIRRHLVEPLADRPVTGITMTELQALLNGKAAGLSKSVMDHLRFHLSDIFDMAKSTGLIANNPATELYTPKNCEATRAKRIMSIAQFNEAMKVFDIRESTAARLAMWEGLRPGEITGLQVWDIDVAESRLHVRRRVYWGDVDTPKVELSTRGVALTGGTRSMLSQWMGTLRDLRPEAWLFPSENPNTPKQYTALLDTMQEKLEPLGLDWFTFQILRTSCNTRMKQAGIDANTRAQQLGHTVNVNKKNYITRTFDDQLKGKRLVNPTIGRARNSAYWWHGKQQQGIDAW